MFFNFFNSHPHFFFHMARDEDYFHHLTDIAYKLSKIEVRLFK